MGTRWLWRGLAIRLAPGERVAISGPSGSGKTLLLRALAGLDEVDEGEIALAGRYIDDWPMPSYRATVAYLPQRATMVEGTVEANLRLPFTLRTHSRREFPLEEAERSLSDLGRPSDFLRQPATELSGGEAQLVALLRALLIKPKVLLLDEPSASLDESASEALEAVVGRWLEAEHGRAVIWTSHRSSQLERVTDRRVDLSVPT